MGGHPSCTRNVSDKGASQCSPDGWEAPRLSLALLHAKAGQYDVFKTKVESQGTTIKTLDEASLKSLLEHIQERLEKGVTEAWLSKEGYDYDSGVVFRDASGKDQLKALPYKPAKEAVTAVEELIKKTVDVDKVWNDPEERWARTLVERFVFSAYASPKDTHGMDVKALFDLYPKAYSFLLPCQYFSTYCILSRGFTIGEVSTKVAAGCGCSASSTKFPCFARNKTSATLAGDPRWKTAEASYKTDYAKYKAEKAKWDADKSAHDAARQAGGAPTPLSPPPVAPSHASYGYPKQTSAPAFAKTEMLVAADIAVTPGSVVTFNPGGGESDYQDLGKLTHIASVIRVSGSRIQFMDTGVVVGDGNSGGEGGMVDHGFRTGAMPHAASCVGVGVLKKPGDLAAATTSLVDARPLGLVRLVVVDTSVKGSPQVRFVSKLLHMRYPVSLLMWSLRGLPVEDISVMWLVYASGGSTWTNAISSDTAPSTILAKGAGTLFLSHVVRGDAGNVAIYRRKADGPKNGYNKDFTNVDSPPARVPEMGLDYPLIMSGSRSGLGTWAVQWASFDKRFIHLGSAASGNVDSSDVDVPFFKP